MYGSNYFGKKVTKTLLKSGGVVAKSRLFFYFHAPVGADKLHKLCLISSTCYFSALSDLMGPKFIKISVLRQKSIFGHEAYNLKKVIFQIFTKFLTKFRPDFSKIQILKNYIKKFSVQKKEYLGQG